MLTKVKKDWRRHSWQHTHHWGSGSQRLYPGGLGGGCGTKEKPAQLWTAVYIVLCTPVWVTSTYMCMSVFCGGHGIIVGMFRGIGKLVMWYTILFRQITLWQQWRRSSSLFTYAGKQCMYRKSLNCPTLTFPAVYRTTGTQYVINTCIIARPLTQQQIGILNIIYSC